MRTAKKADKTFGGGNSSSEHSTFGWYERVVGCIVDAACRVAVELGDEQGWCGVELLFVVKLHQKIQWEVRHGTSDSKRSVWLTDNYPHAEAYEAADHDEL